MSSQSAAENGTEQQRATDEPDRHDEAAGAGQRPNHGHERQSRPKDKEEHAKDESGQEDGSQRRTDAAGPA